MILNFVAAINNKENKSSVLILFLLSIFAISHFQLFFLKSFFSAPVILTILFILIYPLLKRNYHLSIFLFIIFLIDFSLAYLVIDFSSDGSGYHDQAILSIANGNDLYFNESLDHRISGTPVMQWIFPAIFKDISDLNSINSGGKLFASSILFLVSIRANQILFENQKENSDIFRVLIISFVISCPPIFWSQLHTAYGDYWTYWSCALILISAIGFINSIEEKDKIEFTRTLFLGLVFAATVKYQSALIGFLIFIFLIIYYLIKKLAKEQLRFFFSDRIFNGAVILIGSFIFLTTFYKNYLISGYFIPGINISPVKNVLFDNIFYKETSKYLHLFYSLFSSTELNTINPKINFFQINNFKDLLKYGHADLRFGAYGPLSSVLFTMTIFAVFKLRGINLFLPIIFIIIFALLPGVGTSRFYPFIQILPALFLIVFLTSRYFKIFAFLIILNLSFVSFGALSYQLINTLKLKFSVKFLETNKQYAIKFDNSSYIMDQVLGGKLNRKIDQESKCYKMRDIIPFFHINGFICEIGPMSKKIKPLY